MKHRALLWLLLSIAFASPAVAAPIPLGQQDTFEIDNENWFFGGGPMLPPMDAAIVDTGGPGGAGDGYMLLTSTGIAGSPSGRLSISNADQWSGDYSAGGITALSMWVNNFGPSDLALRLAFEVLGMMGPTDIAFSADPVLVPQGSGWQQIVFPILDSDLINFFPGGSIEDALTNTTLIRLYHSPTDNAPNPFAPIEAVAAQLGVDDITALATVPVPEPSTLVLFGAGLAGVLSRRRKSRAD
jgi:hypothetical protein